VTTGQDPYLARFLAAELPVSDSPAPPREGLPDLPRRVEVEYAGEKKVEAAPLKTILEVSRENGIPHVCECGAQAKCSTCRILILQGRENCLPRNRPEERIALLKGFPPEVRLACQTRITGPVQVRRLVWDSEDANDAMQGGSISSGRELQLAVLFSDIRGFTSFSEENLPYDVVHALNRYFNTICEPIDRHRGYVDKYMGDGIMVLFGLDPRRQVHPCVDAVRAALGMLERMPVVNGYLRAQLGREFRIGIGISYGPVVVGEIGFRLKKQFTAIGDIVNVASRLEGQTKIQGAAVLVSDPVRQNLTEGDFAFGRTLEVTLAGKSHPLLAHEVLPRNPET